ncbi:MAG TPA: STAS domain-containing protein [Mycobacteriales bacterium]|nr:STAS domain-containing protein [Mycobacteriales bacterium]
MVAPHAFPLLLVSVERAGDSATLRLDGELDCATAPDLDAALTELQSSPSPPRRIYIDADRLTFIDVSGLSPLVAAVHRLPDGGHLQLRNARRQVVRVIRLLELADDLGLDH